MLTNTELNKDIKNMTMNEIDKYVDDLKETIYHLTSTMQTLISSISIINNDLNEFNKIKLTNTKKLTNNNSLENKEINDEYSINKNEDIMNNYDNNDIDIDGPYTIEYIFSIEKMKETQSIILGKDNTFCIKYVEPDEYMEIKLQRAFDPRFLFDIPPTKDTALQLWNNFTKTNYISNIFHSAPTLIDIIVINSNSETISIYDK